MGRLTDNDFFDVNRFNIITKLTFLLLMVPLLFILELSVVRILSGVGDEIKRCS